MRELFRKVFKRHHAFDRPGFPFDGRHSLESGYGVRSWQGAGSDSERNIKSINLNTATRDMPSGIVVTAFAFT